MKQTTLLLLALVMFGCNSKKDTGTVTPSRGTVRDKGAPNGQSVKKTIGAEGGNLTSADSKLTVTVPPRAVSGNTEFSVQPINNTLPGGRGQAYRLLPEGIDFSKPVTLTFRYDPADLAGTSSQLLFMAYQPADGIWRYLPKTALNETDRTLEVATTHFSDWAPFAQFWLYTETRKLRVGGSTQIKLMGPFTLPNPDGEPDELEVYDLKPLEDPNKIRNWRIDGYGTLDVTPSRILATYKAPLRVPPANPQRISVEVVNFIPPKFQDRPGHTGRAVIYDNITVEDESYFTGTLGGAQFNLPAMSTYYLREDDMIIMHGNFTPSTGLTLITYLNGTSITGTYPFSINDDPGTGFAGFLEAPGVLLKHKHKLCPAGQATSSGGIQITNIEKVGDVEYITGTFSGNIYKEVGVCDEMTIITVPISGKFKLLRM